MFSLRIPRESFNIKIPLRAVPKHSIIHFWIWSASATVPPKLSRADREGSLDHCRSSVTHSWTASSRSADHRTGISSTSPSHQLMKEGGRRAVVCHVLPWTSTGGELGSKI
ncbi:hypothetical protein AVEN_66639-1 [Araneus ventricosus]|uniref:Uncharacterized protein n=1 Tax=Araneus ventricosus TaxID=182803 RepID=A0A4Y2QC10_ARAVE|nr:hypothetical protein AVEN_66639-1 [Araneus ventricosus]